MKLGTLRPTLVISFFFSESIGEDNQSKPDPGHRKQRRRRAVRRAHAERLQGGVRREPPQPELVEGKLHQRDDPRAVLELGKLLRERREDLAGQHSEKTGDRAAGEISRLELPS